MTHPPETLARRWTTFTMLWVSLFVVLDAGTSYAALGDIETIAGSLGVGPATTIGQEALGLAFRAGKLYVADTGNRVIRVVDLGTGDEAVVAGTGSNGFSGDGGPALEASFNFPAYVTADAAGNVFITDQNNFRIRRVDAVSGVIDTIVGDGTGGFAGDGGPGTAARFEAAYGLATDAAGNLFFCDVNNGRIRRWDASTGFVDTVVNSGGAPWGLAIDAAGNLYFGNVHTVYRADAGTFAVSPIGTTDGMPSSTITGVAVDASGNVYATEPNTGVVWRIDALTTAVTRYAGGGSFTPNWGDGGIASAAFLGNPWGVAVDDDGNLFVSGRKIRKVAAASSIIETIAGNGFARYGGDGGPATNAQINGTQAIAVDVRGRVLLAGGGRDVVRRIDEDGTISTIAGGGTVTADGLPATDVYVAATGVAFGPNGDLYIADIAMGAIRRVDSSGIITTVAGGNGCGPGGDGGPALGAQLCDAYGITFDAAGNLYIADEGNQAIRKVDALTGVLTTVAGTLGEGNGPLGDGGPATLASLLNPRGVAVDALGNIFIAEGSRSRIRRVDTAGKISTIAGTGVSGFNGDGIPASTAQIGSPSSIAFDLAGNLYFADTDNNRIRSIDPAGTIHTVAGTGVAGYDGDGGPASSARLFYPLAAVGHPSGDLFMIDQNNDRVRRVRSATCGDGVLTPPGEQCDDGDQIDSNGCSALCRINPSTVSQPAAVPSEVVSTGSVADAANPIQAAVTLPSSTGGSVSIAKDPDGSLAGIAVLSGLLTIHVTPADVGAVDAAHPIALRFVIDAALVPPGELVVTKDGSVVPPCSTPGTLAPAPSCVSARTTIVGGDLEVTVLTLSASEWTLGDVCGATPASGCKHVPTGKSVLLLKNHPTDPGKDILNWTWSNGQATTTADFAAPLERTPFSVCIYDDTGLKLQATAPAGGQNCGGTKAKACWKQTRTGYTYADKALTPDGLQTMSLKAGATGKAKIVVKGRGTGLGMPALPLEPRIRAQLKVGSGAEARCWEAGFSVLQRSAKPAETMKAKSE